METRTTASLFTGGGGFEQGAIMAGLTPLWGVEIRPDIARCAELNTPGLKVMVSDVAAVNYSALPKVNHLHASPSCKKASVANQEAGESPEDIEAAKATCRAIREVNPDSFTLENVWGYREFESFKLIVGQLTRLGYKVDWWHLNSADYGVPQTRKRLILIARKDRQPTRPQPTHSDTPDMFGYYKPWVGWLESIADLVDTLPDSEFAPWQLERLPAELKSMLLAQGSYEGEVVNRSINEPAFTMTANSNQGGIRALLVPGGNNSFPTRDCEGRAFTITGSQAKGTRAYLLNRNKSERDDHYKPESDPAYTVCVESNGRQRAYIIDGQNATSRDGTPTYRQDDAPMFTVSNQAKGATRALCLGRVVKITPRALARFQSFPDEYRLPKANGLACEVTGNAVPPLLAKAICESLKD